VPYVIVPRGNFQRAALRRKFLKKWLGTQLYFKPFFRGAAALHFLTEAERRNSESWGRPSFVIPNGIHPVPAKGRAHPGRAKRPVFGFLGRVDVGHKGLDLLARAVALVQDDLRGAGCSVPIYGPDFGGTQAGLERLIVQLGVGDLVTLEGEVRGERKDKVLKGFDLFLHPSRYEGQPISVLEALARGIPCLVTPGTNIMEEVTKAGCGFAVEGTPEAIALALRKALADRKGLAAKGKRALVLSRRYDWPTVARRTAGTYRRLVRGLPPEGPGLRDAAEGAGKGSRP
jgi:glycosyltransferase involved in cell wall biosynthesis